MHYLRRRTQAAQGIQAASQLDLRHFPQVLTFQRIGAALGELVAQALKYDGGLVVHTAEPALVMTDEQLATLWALQGAGVVAVVAEEVKKSSGNMGYNAATGVYEDMVKAGVIDPAKVTRTALQNAVSIAGMFLTTEAVITEIPKKDEPMPPMGGGMGGMGGGMGGMY